jgi:TRAP-type C4-dicarboxylate transport system permease small subunit
LTSFLKRFFDACHGFVAFAMLPTIVLIVSAEVAARYVFKVPLRWSEEVVSFALLLTSVLALPYCIVHAVHVRVETVYELMRISGQHWADRLSALCGAVFLATLTLGSSREALGMFKRAEVGEFTGLPQWPLAAVIALIAATSALYLLLQMWRPSSPAQPAEMAGAEPAEASS